MRTRHSTVLSVAGVVAAGLVAALVNAQALAGSDGRATTSLASTQLNASSSAAPSDTAVGSSATAINDAIPTTLPASDVNSLPVLFDLGAAGTLTLDDVNGVLNIVAMAPARGWSVSAMSSVDSTTVVVDFTSANASVRATAAVSDSVITVEVTETPAEGAPETVVVTQPTTPSPPTTTALPPTTVRPATPTAPTTTHDDDSNSHGREDDD